MNFRNLMSKKAEMIAFILENQTGKRLSQAVDGQVKKTIFVYKHRKIAVVRVGGQLDYVASGQITVKA